MTDTSTQQRWLSKFLCDELDAAKAWYGRSKDSLEGNPSFSSISSQPQKPRFSDNGSVLHIANQRGGDQSTMLTFVSADSPKAWLQDGQVKIVVRFARTTLDRYEKAQGNQIFDAQAGTVLELREFSIVVDPHGNANEKLRLLVTDCVAARPTSGVRFINPDLQRAHSVGGVKERLTGLLDLRKSISSSQKVDSHKKTPTATQAIQLDDTSDSDIHEVGSLVINTQVQLASQMPTHRPPRKTPDFAVASGANLSRPIEARRSVATTKEPMAHLYSLLGRVQQGFSKPRLTSTTDQKEVTIHNQTHSMSEPQPKRSGQHGDNKLTHTDDVEAADVVDLEQDVSISNGTAAVDIPSSAREEQRGSKVRVKQEGVKDIDDAKSIASPSKIKGHGQLNRDNATSEAMDVDNFGDDTTIIPEEALERPAEDVDVSIRSNSVEHSSPRNTASGVANLAKISSPMEVSSGAGLNISCLHEHSFRGLHQLIHATEDLEISQDQMRILNKPESWQYPAPPMRLPQPNIPVALLKEFKQYHEANPPEAVKTSVSVAEAIVDMKDAVSADDHDKDSSDDEATYSGWDASSSPDRMRQVQRNMKAPSSPIGPPAAILKGKRGTSNNHNLPPDSSAALFSEDDLAEDSPPPAHVNTASSDDPRLALAQFESRTVPPRGSHSIPLASDVESNFKRTIMQSDRNASATLDLPEADSSDIEMDVPQALPLPSSQPSRSKQTSPASRGDFSQRSYPPSTPRSAYKASPYQLVPGSFNSTQVERYHTMQMPINAVDGAAESKPVPAVSSPIAITSGQRTIPPQSTSPMSTGTKRSAPDASMPPHQLPAHKKRREQSFDWDRQSQVEDPVELSRRMRREFLNQRKTIGKDFEMQTHLSESLEPVTVPTPSGQKLGVNASALVQAIPSVNTDTDHAMHDVSQLHATDQDVNDEVQLDNVRSAPIMNTPSRPMEGMSTEQTVATGQLRIYTAFKAAYSSYSGDLKHFVNLCRMIHKLTQGQRLLHRSLWDDFIIRHKTDYPAYLMQCAEEGTSVKTYDAYYQDEIEEPIHIRKIVTPLTLEAVLSSPDHSTSQKQSFEDRKPAKPTLNGDEAGITHNEIPAPLQPQQTGITSSNHASPQSLIRTAQRNAAVSTAPSQADVRVQSATACSTPGARTPDIARQHSNPLIDKSKTGTSLTPRSSLTSRAQDLELRRDGLGGSLVGVNSPIASPHARNATSTESSSIKTVPVAEPTRAQPAPGTKHSKKEVTAQQNQLRKDAFPKNVPTGPKASRTSNARSSSQNASIPGLNLLNSSGQVRAKASLVKSKRSDKTKLQANGQPRSTADMTTSAPPLSAAPLPPVAHQTAGYQTTKRKRGPYLHTVVSNAPKRRDAAHDPAADPMVTGQGKNSEEQEEANNKSRASRGGMVLRRPSELGDAKMDDMAMRGWPAEQAPFTNFARNFLGARAYPHMLGTASANGFEVSKVKTRLDGKGLDLLAWRL